MNLRCRVSQLEVFILKLFTVNALTARPIAASKVSSLQHKIRNNAMERAALEVKRFAGTALALLTCAQASAEEVIRKK